MKPAKKKYVVYAILAAVFFSLSAPLSKLLLQRLQPVMMAGLLYFGAGLGMLLVSFFIRGKDAESKPFTQKEWPYLIAMVLLNIAAPILLLLGLANSTAENVSLVSSFELVATSLIALIVFKEKISKWMWVAIALISASAVLMSVEGSSSFGISIGTVYVLGACLCWGLDNNCTRRLSQNNPLYVTIVKGFGAGVGSLTIALVISQFTIDWLYIALAMALGFFAYGLSVFFYIKAQRGLGAAVTGAYFVLGPFFGVLLSLAIFFEIPSIMFLIALPLMGLGVFIATKDTLKSEEKKTRLV